MMELSSIKRIQPAMAEPLLQFEPDLTAAELVAPHLDRLPRLLIVDDQPLMAEYMASVAHEAGWRVDLATTAAEFESKLAADPPDLIALDLAMPGRDGIELIRYLSANRYEGHLIVVSACDEPIVETSANLAREQGLSVTGYLQKPITEPAFKAHLDQVLASAFDRSH